MDVTVTDSNDAHRQPVLHLDRRSGDIVSPATLPMLPRWDSFYSQQLSAAGGSGSGYTFAATGLPAGLT